MSDSLRDAQLREELKHYELANSIDEFLNFIGDRTIDELRRQEPQKIGPLTISDLNVYVTDPQWRYVRDPLNPGKVFDMNHVLAAADLQSPTAVDLGWGFEVSQWMRRMPSGFLEEDLRSN